MTPIEFFSARLDEEERNAKGALIDGTRWHYQAKTGELHVPSDSLQWTPGTAYIFHQDPDDDEFGYSMTALYEGDHMAYWDPTRVLAEIAAKRALITEACAVAERIDGEWACCHRADDLARGYRAAEFDGDTDDPVPADCLGAATVMRLLGPFLRPFADHADYDEAWAL